MSRPRIRFSVQSLPSFILSFPFGTASVSFTANTDLRLDEWIDVAPMTSSILPTPSEDTNSSIHVAKKRKKNAERVRVTRACDGCKK